MSQKELEKNLKELLELSKKLREANKDLRNKNLRLKKENNRLKDNIELKNSIKKDKKIDLFNLSEDRADVIDEALKIYSKIIKKVRPKKIKATKWGVSDSISVKLFHELYAGNIKIRN